MHLPQISRYENFKFIYLLHFLNIWVGSLFIKTGLSSLYDIEMEIQFEFQLNSYLGRNTNYVIYLDNQNGYIYLHGFK